MRQFIRIVEAAMSDDGWAETRHLLASPANASRLLKSIAEAEEVDEVRKTPGIELTPAEERQMAENRSTTGTPIGRIDNFEVRLDNDGGRVAFLTIVDDADQLVGFADFIMKASDHYQVKMSRVLKKYRGQRIMPRLFIMLARRGITVESDIEQTGPAMRMWQHLYSEAPKVGCKVSAFLPLYDKLVPLASATKTATGQSVYGKSTRFTLVLTKADLAESAGCDSVSPHGSVEERSGRDMELLESPQLIKPIDWNLTDRRVNLARAAYFKNYPVEVFRDFPTATLLVQAGNVGGQIGLLSKQTGLLEYYVHYETTTNRSLGRCATQVKLWRDRLASVRGLASLGFDEILLARFDTVVSDVAQTDRGREFWEVQIGHYSTLKTVGLMTGSKIVCYDRAEPIADWLAKQDGWGKERRYRQRRFFISNLSREQIEGA